MTTEINTTQRVAPFLYYDDRRRAGLALSSIRVPSGSALKVPAGLSITPSFRSAMVSYWSATSVLNRAVADVGAIGRLRVRR
jgi:hypothetical protein